MSIPDYIGMSFILSFIVLIWIMATKDRNQYLLKRYEESNKELERETTYWRRAYMREWMAKYETEDDGE